MKFVFSARKHPVLLKQKQIRLMAMEEAEPFPLWNAFNWMNSVAELKRADLEEVPVTESWKQETLSWALLENS